jgi:hypothetical protein
MMELTADYTSLGEASGLTANVGYNGIAAN